MENIKITNCTRIQEIMLNYKLSKLNLSEEIEIVFEERIQRTKLSHYWHNKDVVHIYYKGYTFYLSAIGDVVVSLCEKGTDNEVVYVKDKTNSGIFREKMEKYIPNDKQLSELLNCKHPKYDMYISANNWYELSVVDPNNNWHDLMLVLDSDYIFDAVIEAVAEMDSVITELEKSKIICVAG